MCDPGLDNIRFRALADPPAFTSLTLGGVPYTDGQLVCILSTPASDNGLIALAHQLIAAKLNAAKNGSLPPSVATCVADADALIGGLLIPPVGGGFLDPSAVSALTTCLKNYNEGAVGPGSCSPIDPGLD